MPPAGLLSPPPRPRLPASGDPGSPARRHRQGLQKGGEQVARYAVHIASGASGLTIQERTVNGQPGLIAQQDGVTVTVFAFDIAGDRITRIWAVRNPDKLRPWTAR
jgi:hypothetical protein